MPLGAVLGSILGPFWSVFLTSVRIWRATGERERRGAEKQEKAQTHSLDFNSFSDVGSSVFFFVLEAPAQARTSKKTRFRVEGIALFACAPFCAQGKRRELPVELPTKTRPDGEAKKKSQSLLGNLQEGHKTLAFWGQESF